MINFKFLHYKTYNAFRQDLDNDMIRPDAIVFIEENLRIWAHGKEYICDGPPDLSNYTTVEQVENKILEMKDPVDIAININSAHAVENHAIAEALRDKADLADLNGYVTQDDIDESIAHKQDELTAGYGIDITGNEISVTLDSDVFIVVDELPEQNINPNKIYIVEEEVEGTTKYYSYKWDGTQWIPMGEKAPSVNLTAYLKSADAANIYQPKGNYAVLLDLDDLLSTVERTYQKKDNYAQVEYVNTKLEYLKEEIKDKYVLKKDVYTPDGGEYSGPSGEGGDDSGGGSSQGSKNKMVTLTAAAYQRLVDLDLVQEDTYYFTYEGEETTNWTFGDTFPIILAGEGMGTFPINLI